MPRVGTAMTSGARIGQGIDQQGAQGVDEAVGALGRSRCSTNYAVLAR